MILFINKANFSSSSSSSNYKKRYSVKINVRSTKSPTGANFAELNYEKGESFSLDDYLMLSAALNTIFACPSGQNARHCGQSRAGAPFLIALTVNFLENCGGGEKAEKIGKNKIAMGRFFKFPTLLFTLFACFGETSLTTAVAINPQSGLTPE